MKQVLAAYGMHEDEFRVEPFGSGLINNTWLVRGSQQYVLQKINTNVFTRPGLIDENIRAIDEYLTKFKPGYRLITPLPALAGETMVQYEGEYYRLFKFIHSRSYDVVPNAALAFEAARQFGKFTNALAGFDAGQLHDPIPHFHDLDLRYSQFLDAIENGDGKRISESQEMIRSLQQYKDIADAYKDIQQNTSFKKRVAHHDTKISNVLFDEHDKAISIIDLDTVMPGYFISDVGDMFRTYLSPAGEEETDFDLIELSDEFFKAIAQGYLGEMKHELSSQEKGAFVYAGKFMIYMQALRFLTDYLRNDVYYGRKYELHNFNRAKNQLILLECLFEKEDHYNSIVKSILHD